MIRDKSASYFIPFHLGPLLLSYSFRPVLTSGDKGIGRKDWRALIDTYGRFSDDKMGTDREPGMLRANVQRQLVAHR